MASKLETKKRIKSIQSIRKTTNAMRLVSSIKLRKMRVTFERTKEYAETIETMLRRILTQGESEVEWLKSESEHEVVLVIASDMGLAAGYNTNIFRLIVEQLSKEAELIVIGKKNRSLLKEYGYQINETPIYSDEFDYVEIARLMDELVVRYQNNEIGKISIIYTKFINAMSFEAKLRQVLPIETKDEEIDAYSHYTEYEPNEVEIMNRLVPQYLKSILYNLFYESKTSEQSSRRLAMEQATDNADELIEDLQLKYNQARQASITQELTEIVAAGEK